MLRHLPRRPAAVALLLLAILGAALLSLHLHREHRRQALHRADSARAQGSIAELGRILDQPEIEVCDPDHPGSFDPVDCFLRRNEQQDSVDLRRNQALAILEAMGPLDSFAAPLLEHRVRAAASPWVRNLAVELLGRSGRNLPDIGGRLEALRPLDTTATWRNALSNAHLQARTAQAVHEAATWIDSMVAREDRIVWPFLDLARLGPRAQDLRTRVAMLLHAPASGVPLPTRLCWRRSTLRTLGWTRDPAWLPFLLEGLRDTVDWPSACAAAISLGDLGDTSAVAALRTVAATHWLEAVRDSARGSIARLRRGTPPPPPSANATFLGIWYLDGNEGLAPPDTVPPHGDTASDCRSAPPESLSTLRYGRHIHSWGDSGPRTTLVQAVPQVSCPLADGLVLGNNEGEWGGEIAWRSADGRIAIVDSTPVSVLYRMPWGLLAASSSQHMGMHSGELLSILPTPSGPPRVDFFLTLPGSLVRSWKTPEGGLYLECSHGRLLLDPRGHPHAWPPLPR